MFSKIKKIIFSYFNQYIKQNNNFNIQNGIEEELLWEKEIKENNLIDYVPLNFAKGLKPFENPLKPYWKDFSHERSEEKLIEQFTNEGRPFTPEEYKKLFYSHISIKNFLGKGKKDYLKKIWKDAFYIKQVLEPLEKMGISYTLDLTGGSVRDFILDKHKNIKDLDFMLSMQSEHIGLYLLKDFFTEEQINKVGLNSTCDIDERKIKLIELCFLAQKEKTQIYNHVEKRKTVVGQDNYHRDIFRKDRLMAVFKTDGKKTNYPIDILLTDFSKPDFIADFDFDICKASMCFVNPHVKKEFPKEYFHLISRFVADIEFWADIHNKTITYNTYNRNNYKVDSSFDNHYPRLKKKFPDYRLVIAGDGDVKPYIESKLFSQQLEKELEEKVQPKKRLKI